jgi:hypothetical protein
MLRRSQDFEFTQLHALEATRAVDAELFRDTPIVSAIGLLGVKSASAELSDSAHAAAHDRGIRRLATAPIEWQADPRVSAPDYIVSPYRSNRPSRAEKVRKWLKRTHVSNLGRQAIKLVEMASERITDHKSEHKFRDDQADSACSVMLGSDSPPEEGLILTLAQPVLGEALPRKAHRDGSIKVIAGMILAASLAGLAYSGAGTVNSLASNDTAPTKAKTPTVTVQQPDVQRPITLKPVSQAKTMPLPHHAVEQRSHIRVVQAMSGDTIWKLSEQNLMRQGIVHPSNKQIATATTQNLTTNHLSTQQARALRINQFIKLS